jgi:hypothetical protein
MRNANRPSGPGKPATDQRDSAEQREELEEMSDDPAAEGAAGADPTRGPRTAERDARTEPSGKSAGNNGSRRAGRTRP